MKRWQKEKDIPVMQDMGPTVQGVYSVSMVIKMKKVKATYEGEDLIIQVPHYEKYEIMEIEGRLCLCGLYHIEGNPCQHKDILADLEILSA